MAETSGNIIGAFKCEIEEEAPATIKIADLISGNL
jgi:hypothetical protein